MADDDAQKTGAEETPSTESQTPPSSTSDGQGAQQDWWNEAQKRGFKSQDEVWKSYRESEKKITEQAENLKQAEKFEKEVEPVIRAIWTDKELLKQVDAKLRGVEYTSTPQDKTSQDTTDIKGDGERKETISAPSSVDAETRQVLRNQIIESFEAENGLDKLDDDTRLEVRKIIGGTMGRWGNPGNAPLPQFKTLLEDAFTIAKDKNTKLKSILEDMPQASDVSAAMPTMSSSTGATSESIKLTPDQEAVAKKMPGGIEGYIEGLKSLMKG